MKNWLESWGAMVAILVAAVTATWVLRSELSEIHLTIAELEGRMEERAMAVGPDRIAEIQTELATVQAKLDRILEGIDPSGSPP